jgi:3-hydroxyisobutyrate dehydrogenase-like beta-hydroxyacid dehydrogenase
VHTLCCFELRTTPKTKLANLKNTSVPETQSKTIGLLHPGAMGATVGAAARQDSHRVLWCSANRSEATRARATAAGLEDVQTLASMVERCDLLLSVCPPAAALDVARQVADSGFCGIYVDANAISPDSMRKLAALFDTDSVTVVDGGIIGPPAHRAGTTGLHLSGDGARQVAACFEAGPLEACCLEGPIGAASALKMAFAAYTKGSTALLALIHALAQAEGVDGPLLAEWERRIPELPGRLNASVPASAVKAWRFGAEMHQIADTFEAAGLPGGFHRAAAEVYDRLAGFKDAPNPPGIDAVSERLRDKVD